MLSRLLLSVLGLVLCSGALQAQTPARARGDVSGDGQITSSDALAVLSHVVARPLPEGWRPEPTGDADCQDGVTARDALIVLSHVVGRDVSEFCVGGVYLGPQPDAARTVRAVVDSTGATLEATGADGTRYTLYIYSGALADPVEITMTPLSSVEELPMLDGGLVAGVELGPSGLQFLVPVDVLVQPAAGVDGAAMVGFGYETTGGRFRLMPGNTFRTAVMFTLSHFSGFGLGRALGPLNALMPSLASIAAQGAAETALAILAHGAYPGSADPTAVQGILASWFDNGVKPVLQSATANEANLQPALAEYAAWLGTVQRVGADMGSRETEARSLLVQAFRHAMNLALEQCRAQRSLSHAAKVLRLASQSAALGLADGSNGLSSQEIMAVFCLEAALKPPATAPTVRRNQPTEAPFRPSLTFRTTPSGVGSGGSGSAPWAEEVQVPFQVRVLPNGTAADTLQVGHVDPGGLYATQFTPRSGVTSVGLHVTACVRAPGEPRLDSVCRVTQVSYPVDGPHVVVFPTNLEYLHYGAAKQYSASFLAPAPSDLRVSWSATGGSLDGGGLYTAGGTSGRYHVVATSVADPTAVDSSTVLVGWYGGGSGSVTETRFQPDGSSSATTFDVDVSVLPRNDEPGQYYVRVTRHISDTQYVRYVFTTTESGGGVSGPQTYQESCDDNWSSCYVPPTNVYQGPIALSLTLGGYAGSFGRAGEVQYTFSVARQTN